MSRLDGKGKGAAALAAVAFAFIGAKEGFRTKSYRDPVGIWTACIGETRGIHGGMSFTKAQCQDMFQKRVLKDFAPPLEDCVPDAKDESKVSIKRYTAFLSMSYNLGSVGFCRSSVARLWNAGDHVAACHAILRYDRAKGRVLPGLELRREDEEAYCLEGLAR